MKRVRKESLDEKEWEDDSEYKALIMSIRGIDFS